MLPVLKESSIANFQDIVNAIKSSQCILFLGAGVHYPPPDDSPYAGTYPEKEQPPLGNALANELAKDSLIYTDRDFADCEKKAIAVSVHRG